MIHDLFHGVIILGSASGEPLEFVEELLQYLSGICRCRRGDDRPLRTNLMVGPIVISQFATLSAKVFLHQRVNDDLLAYGVTSDFPGELADPA